MTRLARSVFALTLALSACNDGDGKDAGDTDADGTNRPPPAPTVRIQPKKPVEGSPLKVTWDEVEDPDGDPVTYEIRWKVDVEGVNFRPQRAEIPGNVVARGQTWTVRVFATDGKDRSEAGEASVTIENQPPVVTVLDWWPEAPRRGDAVSVHAEATDPEGDAVQLTVTWLVNGTEVASGPLDRNGNAVLADTAFAKGDVIVARVTASDGEDTAEAETDEIVVANTPPGLPVVRFGPAYAQRGDELSCEIVGEVVDADGDPVTYEVEWTRDRASLGAAVPLVPGTPATRQTTGSQNGELWACLVRASDGTDKSEPAWGAVVLGEPAPDVAAMALGQTYGCAARSDGRVACWGLDIETPGSLGGRTRRTQPPLDVSFTKLAAGSTFACGVSNDLDLHCWGSGIGGPLVGNKPEGVFLDVAIAGSHACALGVDGSVTCWGVLAGEAEPEGPFQSVSVGTNHACADDANRMLTCWHPNGTAMAGTPDVPVRSHTSAGGHACAILDDLTVTCWGNDTRGQATPPAGTFLEVAAGRDFTCGVKTDGTLACWGANDVGQASPPTGRFIGDVWAGEAHACARELSGEIVCWGDGRGGALVVPWGRQADVSTGADYACFLTRKGLVSCTGSDIAGETRAPWGQFVQVDAGVTHTCARTTADDVVCWGDDSFGQVSGLPAGKYADVTAGLDFTCAIEKQTQAIDCVGTQDAGLQIPALGSVLSTPSGRHTKVTGGGGFACALAVDGTATCWGTLPPKPAAANVWRALEADPAGTYVCGLLTDGSPRCTAPLPLGIPNAPQSETFASLTAGGGVACGIRPDGTVDCWGSAVSPAVDPPQDVLYDRVSAGADGAVCALDRGGHVWCWGNWARQPLDYGL